MGEACFTIREGRLGVEISQSDQLFEGPLCGALLISNPASDSSGSATPV